MKNKLKELGKKYGPIMFRHYIISLLALAFISVFLTYGEITKSQLSDIQNPKLLITLIVLDLILFLFLSISVARKIFHLWDRGKYRSARLQNKIILMFCLVAAVPTIIITVFSTIFFNFGIH